jgi:hypothetical protein
MDFRPLDRMGGSDQELLDEPYRPFYYWPFVAKPAIVKQYIDPHTWRMFGI